MPQDLTELYEQLFGQKLVEPTTEQDVKNILSCIRTSHGQFDEADEDELRKSSSMLRTKVKLVAGAARKNLAGFTTAISSQLYDDPFRFFFELIQNADDAKFKTTVVPTIQFRVRASELVVESNEIGFSLADVLSICHTGQSSKIKDSDTTGEKGFGFKSVFGIASKVHLQSGQWSFRFEHEREQDGMGMVLPIWEPGSMQKGEFNTSFRLIFSEQNPDALELLCQRLEQQTESIVYALRKLRKISIVFDKVANRTGKLSFQQLASPTPEGFRQVRSIRFKVHCSHTYRVADAEVLNMPPRRGRTGSRSSIQIAWPVKDETDRTPKISTTGEYIFAFLPVGRLTQLPFLIQGDFLLPGSRQTVLDDSWNQRLRWGAARLFADLVESVVTNKENSLMYTWMRFLPTLQIEGFWGSLQGLIKTELASKQVFIADDQSLHLASEVRLVPDIFLHRGRPLLTAEEQRYRFLSQSYAKSDAERLGLLGVRQLSEEEMVELIKQDVNSTSSHLHATPLADPWHEAFMLLIERLWHSKTLCKSTLLGKQLGRLNLIPIMDGQLPIWCSPSVPGGFYFCNVVDEGTGDDTIRIEMPTDVGFAVVRSEATASVLRKRVYRSLGARNATDHSLHVCTAILAAQRKTGDKQKHDLLRHLELLFWFSQNLTSPEKSQLLAVRTDGLYTTSSKLFFQSHQPYHAAQLIHLHESTVHEHRFLHPMYQDSPVASRTRAGMSWLEWLQDMAGVRWYPPLTYYGPSELHPMIITVRDQYPGIFLPMLQHHWVQEYGVSCQSDVTKSVLKESLVLCMSGSRARLDDVWFPSKEIVEWVQHLKLEHDVPIVALPDMDDGYRIGDWRCLSDLDVISDAGLRFYKHVLLVAASKARYTPEVFKIDLLYRRIGETATLSDQADMKELFTEKQVIWDPKSLAWWSMKDCVWASPTPLRTRFVVSTHYNAANVKALFQTVLEIGETTLECLVEELVGLSSSTCLSPSDIRDNVTNIYSSLKEMAVDGEKRQFLR